jgi:hypothetical protein
VGKSSAAAEEFLGCGLGASADGVDVDAEDLSVFDQEAAVDEDVVDVGGAGGEDEVCGCVEVLVRFPSNRGDFGCCDLVPSGSAVSTRAPERRGCPGGAPVGPPGPARNDLDEPEHRAILGETKNREDRRPPSR